MVGVQVCVPLLVGLVILSVLQLVELLVLKRLRLLHESELAANAIRVDTVNSAYNRSKDDFSDPVCLNVPIYLRFSSPSIVDIIAFAILAFKRKPCFCYFLSIQDSGDRWWPSHEGKEKEETRKTFKHKQKEKKTDRRSFT
jgi:hypothetical protein